jgi:dTDP-4-dehydrorhamnose reductase
MPKEPKESKEPSGIFHWSDGASITWFDFALEIQTQALALGLLKSPCTLKPIPTSEYPTPAARPLYSVMSRVRARAEFDCPTNAWQAELTRCLLASSKV